MDDITSTIAAVYLGLFTPDSGNFVGINGFFLPYLKNLVMVKIKVTDSNYIFG